VGLGFLQYSLPAIINWSKAKPLVLELIWLQGPLLQNELGWDYPSKMGFREKMEWTKRLFKAQ